jgi:hypothetical protein
MRGEIICRSNRKNRDEREGGDPSDTAASLRLFGSRLWLGLLNFCGSAALPNGSA